MVSITITSDDPMWAAILGLLAEEAPAATAPKKGKVKPPPPADDDDDDEDDEPAPPPKKGKAKPPPPADDDDDEDDEPKKGDDDDDDDDDGVEEMRTELRGVLKAAIVAGQRDEVKALIQKCGGSTMSNIPDKNISKALTLAQAL